MSIKARIADLDAKLAARTGGDGKPLKGYAKNVEAILAEKARLTSLTADQRNPVGSP